MNQSYSIKLPEYRQAKTELFKLLNLNDLNVLLSCFDSGDAAKSHFENEQPSLKVKPTNGERQSEYKPFCRLISHQLKLDLNDKRNKIIIDKYYYLIKFSLENLFNREQISCLLTILKHTHDLACDTSFGNLEETFDYFKNSLLIHAVHRPPFSLQLFNTKQLELVFDYIFNSYFKQFKFYKYVFSDAIKLNVKFQYTNKTEIAQEATDRLSELNLESERDANIKMDEPDQAEQEAVAAQKAKETQEKNELREFIRNYLGNQLDKMKKEITNEFNLGSEQKTNTKPSSGTKSPKVSKSAKKK
jgi:hypothetical protein